MRSKLQNNNKEDNEIAFMIQKITSSFQKSFWYNNFLFYFKYKLILTKFHDSVL